MKRIIIRLAAAVAYAALAAPAFAAPNCESIVYRLYQPNAVDHLFALEQEAFNMSSVWRMEGLVFFACTSPGEGLVEIKRYYSRSQTDHLYLPAGESAPAGYALEGIAFYIAAKEEACLLPLFLARRGGDTILTFDPAEVGRLNNDNAWSLVKIIGWVRPYTSVEIKLAADCCRKSAWPFVIPRSF